MYNSRPTNARDRGGFLEGNNDFIDSSNECPSSTINNPNQGNMAIFTMRLATFLTWPIELIISKTSLAEAGFFYTKKSDMVECYSCHGKIKDWQIGDDAFKEHKRHFPRCALVQYFQIDGDVDEVDSASVSSKYAFNQNKKTSINSQLFATHQNQTARIVDTNKILHHRQPPQLTRTLYPQYCEASARLTTFKEWKGQQIPVTLVEAGFFSVGEPDQTKCFYCGGGLRSWGPNDDPWIEHAKWFPKCEWLIRKKGESFVQRVQEEFARTQNTTNHLNDQKHQQMSPNKYQNRTSTNRQSTNNQTTFEEAMKSESVKQILEMGFDITTVGEVVQCRLTSTGDVFKSAAELLDSVIIATESPSNAMDATQPMSCGDSKCPRDKHNKKNSSGLDQLDCDVPEKLQSMIQDLRDKTTCKICMDDDACIVFVPCGHLVTCLSCSPSLSLCPICRTEIKSHIQAHF